MINDSRSYCSRFVSLFDLVDIVLSLLHSHDTADDDDDNQDNNETSDNGSNEGTNGQAAFYQVNCGRVTSHSGFQSGVNVDSRCLDRNFLSRSFRGSFLLGGGGRWCDSFGSGKSRGRSTSSSVIGSVQQSLDELEVIMLLLLASK